MRKRGDRPLKELYDLTERMPEAEVAPVLVRNCRIQGPAVDETDRERLRSTNSGPFSAGKKYTILSENLRTRSVSATCNVCSAPCSSCMHLNRTLSAMESKIDSGFSGSTCGIKEADTCSSVDLDRTPTYKSRICDVSQHAASETSNLLSASPTRDCSANAESKATLKPSVTCDASEDIDIPLTVPSVETIEETVLEKKRHDTADVFCPSNSHTVSDLCHRTFSSQEEEHCGSECNGDNISCISGVRGSSTSAGGHSFHEKDAPYFSASSSTLLAEAIKNEAKIKVTDCFNGSDNRNSQSNYRRSRTRSKGSLEDNAGSADPAFNDKSDFSEFHLLSISPSPKVEPPCYETPSSSGQDGVIKNSEAAVKIAEPCLETENGTDNEISSDKLARSSAISKQSEMLKILTSSTQGTQKQPQSIMVGGGNSESETELEDVKVCDICGDAGREGLLAICSRCSDGAEHIYCMREMLRKVPEGEWLCEECRLKEDTRNKEERQLKVETINKAEMSETTTGPSKDFKHKDTEKKLGKSETVFGTSKECMVKGDTGKKMESKFEKISGTSKHSSLKATSHNSLRTSSKLPPNIDTKVKDTDLRGTPKGLQSQQLSFKRQADSQDIISPTNSKKSLEASVEAGSPRKKIAFLRESSFKDTGKGRIANMLPSIGSQPSNVSHAFSRSQSSLGSGSSNVQGLLRPTVGLSKSASFNNFHAKPKVNRESAPIDTRKEALVRSMSKSASFKSGSSGHSSVVSASKIQFINQRPLENPRGLKLAKETSVMEKKKSSMPDRPPGNSLVRAVASVVVPKLDSKMAKNGIKLKNTSESNMNKASDVPNSLGVNGTKKYLTSSSNRSGGESFSVERSAEDKRARQHSKEGACGSSSAIDKLYNNTDAAPKRGILQTVESSHRDDKTKDHNTSKSPRKVLLNGNRVLRCLRCNETSHATQFCSINKIKLSALKPSAEQNSREANKKDNKWKDAVEAAITKSRIQKSSRQLDEPEGFPVSSADMSFDVVTSRQEILRSSEPDPSKTTDAADLGQQAMQPIKVSSTPLLGDLSANVAVTDELNVKRVMHILPDVAVTDEPDPSKRTDAADLRQQAMQPIKVSSTPLLGDLNANVAVTNELNVKRVMHILPDEASLFSKPLRTSAIPEHNFIWHGSIEVLTTRRDHELFDGIQVHLSSCASLKVHDVVIKFSSTLQLEEVSRISSWPWQFQGSSPKEENIALFLFAKDVESYERSYSKLLEKMLKNDLALRGNIDGIDLLIYPSNNLPLNSQRWNRLFYLWGVFRGRKTDCSKFLPSSQKKPSGPILKAEPLVQDLPCSLSSLVPPPQKDVLVENTGNESPHRSPKSKALKSSTSRDDLSISSFKFDDKMPNLQNYLLLHNSSDRSVADSTVPVVHISSSFPVDHPLGNMNHLSSLLVTHPKSTFQKNTSQSCPEVKNDDTYPRNIDHDPEGKPVNPCVHVTANSEEVDLNRELSPNYSDCRQSMEICRTEKMMAEKDISLKNESVLYDGPQGNQMEVDHLSREFRPTRKRAHSCSTETGSQASGETSRSTGDPTMWTDNASCLPFKDEREQKKMCYSERHLGTGFREETFYAKLSSKVHPLEHRKFLDVSCGEAIIHESPSDGKFFPLEPSPLKTAKADEVVHIVSSDDEETPGSNTPNLELVLGGEKRAPKPKTRPLLFQSADRKVGQKNPLVSAADDEDAALSLSLAVPASKAAKPILKPQQLMSDMPHVNTSLLLFSASTDTG